MITWNIRRWTVSTLSLDQNTNVSWIHTVISELSILLGKNKVMTWFQVTAVLYVYLLPAYTEGTHISIVYILYTLFTKMCVYVFSCIFPFSFFTVLFLFTVDIFHIMLLSIILSCLHQRLPEITAIKAIKLNLTELNWHTESERKETERNWRLRTF